MRRIVSHGPPSFSHEFKLRDEGFIAIAGIDEAGRGAWAGPVHAACVILPITDHCVAQLALVNDSKQLSPNQRDHCRTAIIQAARAIGEGSASSTEIDQLGIVPATRLAMRRAVEALPIPADALVIDAVRLPSLQQRQDVFFFADAISLSVAAASIIAKTSRDRQMLELDLAYPGYGFAKHKGYGTQLHRTALGVLGVTEVHRKSYAPIKQCSSIFVASPDKLHST